MQVAYARLTLKGLGADSHRADLCSHKEVAESGLPVLRALLERVHPSQSRLRDCCILHMQQRDLLRAPALTAASPGIVGPAEMPLLAEQTSNVPASRQDQAASQQWRELRQAGGQPVYQEGYGNLCNISHLGMLSIDCLDGACLVS